jgi:tetratricopeptide (TPR) repeat protein
VKKLLLFVVAIGSAASLRAQAVDVLYADGLEVQRGAGWAAVEAGATLEPDAVVRLAAGRSADLGRGNSVITLTRAGSYRIGDLLRSAASASSWSIGAVVGSKLSALAGANQGTDVRADVAGVRGRKHKADTMNWVLDEADEAIEAGLDLLAKGQRAEALSAFQRAEGLASDQDGRSEALFYGAYTSDLLGQKAQAVRLLARVSPSPDADYYRDFVLLKSRLLVEGAAAAEALTLLDAYIATNPSGADAQEALLLSAFAYRSLGDNPSAVATLNRVRDLGPATDLGKKAAAMAAELR